jgi:hypothetical protein
MKKPRSKKIVIHPMPATPDEIKVGEQMATLNRRDRAIQKRLGKLNAESAKLSAEQHGIALAREKLRREFDHVSNP